MVENTPQEFQRDIKKTLNVAQPEANFRYSGDVVDTEVWQADTKARLMNENPGVSEMQIDEMLKEEVEKNRGQITSYRSEDGETVNISGFSGYEASPSLPILREKAWDYWSGLGEDKKSELREMFNNKKQEEDMTLVEGGVQLFGGAGFLTPASEESPENCLVEGVCFYQTNGYQIQFLDPVFYDFLKENVFAGKEFFLGSTLL